jgi:DNA-binding NarL/FixJ family response regulator
LLYCQALAACLAKHKDIELVAYTGSGPELLLLVKQRHIDVVLVDIRMTGMDGIETCRKSLELQPGIGVIAITMYDDPAYVAEMYKAGALGYLLKDAEEEDIIASIKAVYKKGTSFDAHSTPALNDLVCSKHAACKLNERQKQAMILVGKSYTSEQMKGILNMGIDSVNLLRKNLYPACDVDNLVDLIKCGMRCRLITMERSKGKQQ